MIDEEGYRHNVGIVLLNPLGKVFWAQRHNRRDAWQFPQGGIDAGETAEQALFRELEEEVGLQHKDVAVLGETRDWISYLIPKAFRRHHSKPLCIGQKQKWFLLRLLSGDDRIQLDSADSPEFDEWCWVDYYYPIDQVIDFKRSVYDQVLREFEPLI